MAYCKSCGKSVVWWNVARVCDACAQGASLSHVFDRKNVKGSIIDMVTNDESVYLLLKNGQVIQLNHQGEDVCVLPFWNVISFAAASNHLLVVTKGGQVHMYGKDYEYSVSHIPKTLTNVVDVFTTSTIAYALRANGSLVGWGIEWDEWREKPYFVATNKHMYNQRMSTVNYEIDHVSQLDNECKHVKRMSIVGEELSANSACIVLRKDQTIYAWGAFLSIGQYVPARDNNVVDVYITKLLWTELVVLLYRDGSVRFCMNVNHKHHEDYMRFVNMTHDYKIAQIVIDAHDRFAFVTHDRELFVYSNRDEKMVNVQLDNLKVVKIIMLNSKVLVLTEAGILYTVSMGYSTVTSEMWGVSAYPLITATLKQNPAQ